MHFIQRLALQLGMRSLSFSSSNINILILIGSESEEFKRCRVETIVLHHGNGRREVLFSVEFEDIVVDTKSPPLPAADVALSYR